MITTCPLGDTEGVIEYHREGFDESAERSYDVPQYESISLEWGGKGAELAGLSGKVKLEDARNALNGLIAGEQIPHGYKDGVPHRRVATDIQFAPDKSLSVEYARTGDIRIPYAVKLAVIRTMEMLEASARVQRKDGEYTTGNLMWFMAQHETARPAGHSLGDPHIHFHVVVINATNSPNYPFTYKKDFDHDSFNSNYAAQRAAGPSLHAESATHGNGAQIAAESAPCVCLLPDGSVVHLPDGASLSLLADASNLLDQGRLQVADSLLRGQAASAGTAELGHEAQGRESGRSVGGRGHRGGVNSWHALDTQEIMRQIAGPAQQFFSNELNKILRSFGFDTEAGEYSPVLKGYKAPQLGEFSQRSTQIHARAKELGLNMSTAPSRSRRAIKLGSREDKPLVSRSELRAHTHERMTKVGIRVERNFDTGRYIENNIKPSELQVAAALDKLIGNAHATHDLIGRGMTTLANASEQRDHAKVTTTLAALDKAERQINMSEKAWGARLKAEMPGATHKQVAAAVKSAVTAGKLVEHKTESGKLYSLSVEPKEQRDIRRAVAGGIRNKMNTEKRQATRAEREERSKNAAEYAKALRQQDAKDQAQRYPRYRKQGVALKAFKAAHRALDRQASALASSMFGGGHHAGQHVSNMLDFNNMRGDHAAQAMLNLGVAGAAVTKALGNSVLKLGEGAVKSLNVARQELSTRYQAGQFEKRVNAVKSAMTAAGNAQGKERAAALARLNKQQKMLDRSTGAQRKLETARYIKDQAKARYQAKTKGIGSYHQKQNGNLYRTSMSPHRLIAHKMAHSNNRALSDIGMRYVKTVKVTGLEKFAGKSVMQSAAAAKMMKQGAVALHEKANNWLNARQDKQINALYKQYHDGNQKAGQQLRTLYAERREDAQNRVKGLEAGMKEGQGTMRELNMAKRDLAKVEQNKPKLGAAVANVSKVAKLAAGAKRSLADAKRKLTTAQRTGNVSQKLAKTVKAKEAAVGRANEQLRNVATEQTKYTGLSPRELSHAQRTQGQSMSQNGVLSVGRQTYQRPVEDHKAVQTLSTQEASIAKLAPQEKSVVTAGTHAIGGASLRDDMKAMRNKTSVAAGGRGGVESGLKPEGQVKSRAAKNAYHGTPNLGVAPNTVKVQERRATARTIGGYQLPERKAPSPERVQAMKAQVRPSNEAIATRIGALRRAGSDEVKFAPRPVAQHRVEAARSRMAARQQPAVKPTQEQKAGVAQQPAQSRAARVRRSLSRPAQAKVAEKSAALQKKVAMPLRERVAQNGQAAKDFAAKRNEALTKRAAQVHTQAPTKAQTQTQAKTQAQSQAKTLKVNMAKGKSMAVAPTPAPTVAPTPSKGRSFGR